ncbi:MAG: hypothetical protein ACE5ID_09060 [Acidobacteriota bacterium]
MSQALIASRQLLVEQEGWKDPMAGQPLEVYLVGGRSRGGSLVVPLDDPFLTSDEGSASFVILAGARRTWALQALHQYLHVLQVGQSMREEPWFYEASALYAEERLSGGQVGLAALLARRFREPQRSLILDLPELRGSATVFLAHLAQRHGEGILKLAWELAGRQPGEGAVMALDSALRLTDQTTFLGAFREYTLLNGYPDPGQRPAGTYGHLGVPVPVAASAWEVTSLPDGNSAATPILVEPLGAAYIRMHGLAGVAALHLELETSGESPIAGDVLVSDDHVAGGWVAAPLQFKEGRADLGVPLEAGGELVVVVRNQRLRKGPAEAVRFSAVPDPSFPYDLAFLSADASPGQIDLSWGSESQRRMYGWTVYRSLHPQGPFHLMNNLPLPSLGDSDSPMAYHFIDTDIKPGTLYYYQVEGLTLDGLARRSTTIVRRAAPLARSRRWPSQLSARPAVLQRSIRALAAGRHRSEGVAAIIDPSPRRIPGDQEKEKVPER